MIHLRRSIGAVGLILLSCGSLLGQPNKERASVVSVVNSFDREGGRFDCDSCEGVMNCIRYCTNRTFLRLDSALERRFEQLLSITPSDSAKDVLKSHQISWLVSRREQCLVHTEGLTGSFGAIRFVECLNALTNTREMEVSWLIDHTQN